MSNHKPLVVANWKMHLSIPQGLNLLRRLDVKVPDGIPTDVVLCAPSIMLQPLKDELKRLSATRKFQLGAQTVNEHDEGAYTGEVSAAQLRPLVDMALCGHSERRMNFHETTDVISRKVAACFRNDITPILCVGENLHERESGHSKRVVLDQITSGLRHLTKTEVGQVVIAYEPVWALSSTKHSHPADPEIINTMLVLIRQTLEELYGEEVGMYIRILYGGSVDADNVRAYLQLDDCGGVLVGGASLNWAKFCPIVIKASQLPRPH